MAKSRSKTVVIVEDAPVAETPAPANIEPKRIAERAYELAVKRGCEEVVISKTGSKPSAS